jgi:hypothetical protein
VEEEMNTINRILVVLGLLVVMVVCAAVFVAPIPVLGELNQGLQGLVGWLAGVPAVWRIALGVLFALAWVFICIILLILEIAPRRRREVSVQKVDGGRVEVSLRTVEEHLTYELDRMRGVLRSQARVTAQKDGVLVDVRVDTAGDEAVPLRASRVVELVRTVVEDKVGVKLARPPRVHLRAQPIPPIPQRPVHLPAPAPAEEEQEGIGDSG